ncbi:MAG: hypothetical protein JWO70_2707 [Betaproteobacteria bacterium]|nr:hypothetical protein [Betaproteobacteria bacterium]
MITRTMLFTLLLAGASVAAAQTLYKSTMPDGKVSYGEKPVPGAKKVETIEAPPAKTGVTLVRPEEKRNERALPAAAQQSELPQARQNLQKAQAALEAGKEPLPGERTGTAGGSSRLTDAYFERQKGLAAAAEAARKRVEQLETAR